MAGRRIRHQRRPASSIAESPRPTGTVSWLRSDGACDRCPLPPVIGGAWQHRHRELTPSSLPTSSVWATGKSTLKNGLASTSSRTPFISTRCLSLRQQLVGGMRGCQYRDHPCSRQRYQSTNQYRARRKPIRYKPTYPKQERSCHDTCPQARGNAPNKSGAKYCTHHRSSMRLSNFVYR